mgnify:CR=1 FL=1
MGTHEVKFDKYCKDCTYEKKKETKDPCNECLAICARKDSRKPLYFEPKTK